MGTLPLQYSAQGVVEHVPQGVNALDIAGQVVLPRPRSLRLLKAVWLRNNR